MEQKDTYPGTNASVSQMLELAHEYYHAAMTLFKKSEGIPKGFSPFARAPARLCAIHAIELYLNAFLLQGGVSPAKIRGYNHSLAQMSEHELIAKLKFKKLTFAHLTTISDQREYLISRYGPEMVSKHTELSRLTQTLEEVMIKVGNYLAEIPYVPSIPSDVVEE